jgi:hypothetical protein
MWAPPWPSSVTKQRGNGKPLRKSLTSKPFETNVKFCLCWRSSGAEQLPCKQWVGGSNPPASASYLDRLLGEVLIALPAGSGRYPSGQRGQTVNLLAYAFGGSNPPLPTTISDLRTTTIFETGAYGRGGNSSAVERQPSKLGVAGSNPVSRSTTIDAHVAQLAEHALGKGEVSGSIPDMCSIHSLSDLTATPSTGNGR